MMTEELHSLSSESQSRRKSSTSSRTPELIERDGKTVSRTSTGKRKFHNKSKNGCDTCKKRRVKCDEGKPICTKCANMGIDCHYSIPTQSHPSDPSSTSPTGNDSKKNSRRSSKDRTSPTLQHQHLSQHSSHQIPQMQLPQIKTEISSLADQMLQQDNTTLDDFKYPSIPGFNMKSPILDAATLNSLKNSMMLNTTQSVSSQTIQQLTQHLTNQQTNSLRGLLGSITTNPPDPNVNNLSVNYNSLSSNPTISPQPSMSPPGSPTSSQMNHSRINSIIAAENPVSGSSNDSQFNNFSFPSVNQPSTSLNLIDLRLMYHYTQNVAPTITTAGISEEKIWIEDIPNLAFSHPFLMHSVLAFSATHLSRTLKSLEKHVTYHRGEALRLLREAVLEISPDNTDALVASAIILIMDSLANASLPSTLTATSLPASAWIFHVKGAATILTAVWPLPVTSRFYKFISVDLSDLGDIMNEKNGSISELVCFDESIADLYPVGYDSPYLLTLAYLDKLHHEKFKSDFILRIFSFPALLDKTFLVLLMSGDLTAMRIMRAYYTLLRGFTTEMKDKVWFLEGVSKVLPADVDEYSGGGGMHMMLDFLGGGLPSLSSGVGLGYDTNMGPEGFMGA